MLHTIINVVLLPLLAAAVRSGAGDKKNVAVQPGQFMPRMPLPPPQTGLPGLPQMPPGMDPQMSMPQLPPGMDAQMPPMAANGLPVGMPPMPAGFAGYNQQMPQMPPQIPGANPQLSLANMPPLPPGADPQMSLANMPPLPPAGNPQLSLANLPPLPPGANPQMSLANMANIQQQMAALPALPAALNKQFGAQAAMIGLPTVPPADPAAFGIPPNIMDQQVPQLPPLSASTQAVLQGQTPKLPQLSQAELAQFALPTLGPLGAGLKRKGKGKGNKKSLSLANVKLPTPEQVYAQNPGLSPAQEGQMEATGALLQGEPAGLPPLMANALPPDAMPALNVPDASDVSAGASLPALANFPAYPGMSSPALNTAQLPALPTMDPSLMMQGSTMSQAELPPLPNMPGGSTPPVASLLSQGSTMGQTTLPELPNLPGGSSPPVNPDLLPPLPSLPPLPPNMSPEAGIPGYSPPMSQAQVQTILASAPLPPTGIAEPPPPPDIGMTMPMMAAGPPAAGRPQFAGLQQGSGSGSQVSVATMMSEKQLQQENAKFDKWLSEFHQYQKNYMKQQQQWRDYNQAMQKGTTGLEKKFLPSLPEVQPEAMIPFSKPKSSYIEESSSTKRMQTSTNMRSQLVKQQSALHSMAAQLMEREQADFNREKADAAHESQLKAREVNLNVQEKRVAQLQSALVQEQKRVWKQFKLMQAKYSGNGKPAPNSAQKPHHDALLQRSSQVNFQTRQEVQTTSTTTAATTTTTTTQIQHPLRMRPHEVQAMIQTGTKAGSQSGAWMHGSDLHIVQAAQLPAASVDDEDASGTEAGSGDDEDSGAKASGDAASEDSAATGAEDAKGEFADNDDLEQILLQQSTKVRRSSDAVEMPR